MICPCKDCEKKGCGVYHDKCEEYQKYVAWRREINDKIRLENQFNKRKYKRIGMLKTYKKLHWKFIKEN